MKEFDLDVNTNNVNSEIKYSSITNDDKPKWQQKLEDITKKFTTATTYGANKEGVGYYEGNKEPRGVKVTKFGLDPLVFIVLSLGVVIASGVAISVISKKQIKMSK